MLSATLSTLQSVLNELDLFTRSLHCSRIISRATLKNHGLAQDIKRMATDFAFLQSGLSKYPAPLIKRAYCCYYIQPLKKSSAHKFLFRLPKEKMSEDDSLKQYKSDLGYKNTNFATSGKHKHIEIVETASL